jgi:hypothetical protein
LVNGSEMPKPPQSAVAPATAAMVNDRPVPGLRTVARQEFAKVLDHALRWSGVLNSEAAETMALYVETCGFVIMKRISASPAQKTHGTDADQ